MRNTWQQPEGMGPEFWRQEKQRAEQRMEMFDELDPDLRERVRTDNELTAANGTQGNRNLFGRSQAPAEGRIERKRRRIT